MFMDNLEIILMRSIKAVGSKHRLHLIGERRDHVPRDEEGGHVEEVEEDLVAVAQCGSEVTITG
jgi:hypothetical protein